ncbi:MAG: F0F1 ATP synthase subunit A [Anaerolineae bacterium]|nr:F0F1 ATP synthase subunit A [Anaerolineae bacterium]
MDTVFSVVAFRIPWLEIPVRNSVVATWIMMAMVVLGVILLQKKLPFVLEMLFDFITDLVGSFIPGSPSPYVPYLGSLFVFIAVANFLGNVPMLFTPTRDINTPLALALVSLIMSIVFGLRVKGIKFFLHPLVIFDVIGYVSRTMSLTLRLFGNIIAGEVIVAVISDLVPVGAPLVMVALTAIGTLMQAYVFTVLNASYIANAVGD